MNTTTPETDASLIDGVWHNGHRLVHEEVCAKLERERDEALLQAQQGNELVYRWRKLVTDAEEERDKAKGLLSHFITHYEALDYSEATLDELEKVAVALWGVVKERDEARKSNIQLILERERWKAKAEEKIALRCEVEALLGMESKEAGEEQFQKGLKRLRSIIEENKLLIQLMDKIK